MKHEKDPTRQGIWKTRPRTEKERKEELLRRKVYRDSINPVMLDSGLRINSADDGTSWWR